MCILYKCILVYACIEFIGGALLIALDQIGLQDAAAIDNTLSTLDNLMEYIVQDDVFTDLELTERYKHAVVQSYLCYYCYYFILIQMSDCSYYYLHGKCGTYFSCEDHVT